MRGAEWAFVFRMRRDGLEWRALRAGDKARRPSPRYGFLHHPDKLLERERLGQEVELLAVGQVLVEGVLGIARHKNDLDIGLALPELLHQRRSVHLRHDHVGDHDVDVAALPFELRERLEAVAGLDHGITARLQSAGVERADRKSTRLNS